MRETVTMPKTYQELMKAMDSRDKDTNKGV